MRRDVRQLRYAHETLWWAFPPAAHGRLGGALHDVQDVAGAWQDLCVMKKLAAKAERKGRLDVPLEGFMKDVARRARTLYDRFARSLKAFVRGRDRLTEDGC
jgi:CHAD domain-containing protein